MKAEIVYKLCGLRRGIIDTALPAIKLCHFEHGMKRQPFLYGPSAVMICQGQKTGYIRDRVITYDPNSYLVVAGSLPLECEYQADPQRPLLAVIVSLDLVTLHQVKSKMGSMAKAALVWSEKPPDLVAPTPQCPEIEAVVERMLGHLQYPDRTTLFVEDTIKELYYHLLKGEQGSSLFAMLQDGPFSRIITALDYIKTHFDRPLSVEHLASLCHMSPTNFYRTFKAQTGDTPLQLIKKTRLAYAKTLLECGDGTIKSIAHRVGYESPSHFGRDYRTLYGYSPKETPSLMSHPGRYSSATRF